MLRKVKLSPVSIHQRGCLSQDIFAGPVHVTHPPLPLDLCGVTEVWVDMATEDTDPRLFAKFLLLQALLHCCTTLPHPQPETRRRERAL